MTTPLIVSLVLAAGVIAVVLWDNHSLTKSQRRLFLDALKAKDECARMAKEVHTLRQQLHGK